MTNTYYVDQEKVIKNQARGYSLKDGKWINIMRTWDYEIPSYFGGARPTKTHLVAKVPFLHFWQCN
jgi:hypothetical protein